MASAFFLVTDVVYKYDNYGVTSQKVFRKDMLLANIDYIISCFGYFFCVYNLSDVHHE